MSGVVLTVGETMGLALNNVPGSFVTSRALALSFGGAESNVAIGLARLGTPSRWFSKLGNDAIGRLIRRELTAEGVDVRAATSSEHPTGFMLKERLGGERANVWYYRSGSAASTLALEDIPDDLLDGVNLVHCTGIDLVLSAPARETVLAIVSNARRRGAVISFDVNHRERLMPAAAASVHYRKLAMQADLIFAGADEARLLVDAPADNVSLLDALGTHYEGAEAVLKLGGSGAIARTTGGELITRSAVPVDVVDTVGAGDAFVAGYLSERSREESPETALTTAVAAGAHACTIHGDWEGAPTRLDIARLGSTEGVRR